MNLKNLKSAFLFNLIFSTILITHINTQWQVININSSLSTIQDLSVVNQSVIWVLEKLTPNRVYITTNGGLYWFEAGNLPEQSYFISAVNNSTAWVSTYTGKIFKTSNGGLNWIQQIYSHQRFINNLHFFNLNTGYFIADEVNDTIGFFYTRNGGSNWIRSQNAPRSSVTGTLIENCVFQYDTNFIGFCGYLGSNNYKFNKLTGGFEASWQTLNYGTSGAFRTAGFVNSQEGLAADINGNIIITTNGGINWNFRNTALGSGYVHELLILPSSRWVVCVKGFSINLSKDFGANWSNESSLNIAPGYGDAFDTNNIWLSYSNGTAIKYNFLAIGINIISNNVANKFSLMQNFPNPFNPSTNIRFSIPSSGTRKENRVNLSVYDINGKLIEGLVDKNLPQGEYEVTFNGSNYSSGIYFYRLTYGNFSAVNKMILVK